MFLYITAFLTKKGRYFYDRDLQEFILVFGIYPAYGLYYPSIPSDNGSLCTFCGRHGYCIKV